MLSIIKHKIESLLKEHFEASDVPVIEYVLDVDSAGPCYTRIANKPTIIVNNNERDFCSFIFQYSHEYTHHIMHTLYPCVFYHYDWFEEIICEAISYWCLKWFATHFDWARYGIPAYPYHMQLFMQIELDKHYQDDSYIYITDKYFKHELNFDIKRPRLKMSIDLYQALWENEILWRTIKFYNPVLRPQETRRPEWLAFA